MPIRDRDSCAMSYIENPVKIDERVLCAGNGTTDACDVSMDKHITQFICLQQSISEHLAVSGYKFIRFSL